MGGELIRTYGDEMIEKGIEQGIEKGIEIYILANLEDGIDENIIISRLMKNFSLTEEKAKMYFEKVCWYTRTVPNYRKLQINNWHIKSTSL